MLKIQHLLHMCNESHSNKEEEEGAESEPANTSSKESGEKSVKEGETASVGDSKETKDTAKKSSDSGNKDVEMKDAEVPEPGSLSEPGAHQAVAVLGIALIAMGEEIGAEMSLRTFSHLVSAFL